MTIGNEDDLEGIRRVGRVVAETLSVMKKAVAPGISTLELDEIGAEVMRSAGTRSAPNLVYGFPGVNLISVNDEVVHGVPGRRRIAPGDVVKLDVTAELDGYIADAAETVLVPPVSRVAARMQRCSIAAFTRGWLLLVLGARFVPSGPRSNARFEIADSTSSENCRATVSVGLFTSHRRSRTTTRPSQCTA